MSDNVYLSADRSRVVPPNSAGKTWQVPRAEAVRLGLLESAEKPVQERRTPAFDRSTAKTPPQARRSAKRK